MAKIISLSGIHNCGKTTTFNKLKELYKDNKKILFISEMNTALNELGLGINNEDDQLELLPLRQGLSQFSLITMERFFKELTSYTHVITDRCSLDTTLYTHYFADKGDMSNNDQLTDININLIKSFYQGFEFKIFYFGIDKWIDNKRIDSMNYESGVELEHNYFDKFKTIFINYNNIDQIISEIESE
jgi:thymidylate kinase